MIKIICKKKDQKINYIEIKGHSEANKKGHDLICSAVSGIVIGAIKAIETLDENDIKVNDGHVEIKVKEEVSDKDIIRLEMMITQLELIANTYPKNVNIIKE